MLVRIADRSDGGNEDERASIFFLFHQIQHPLSGIGSPHLGSSPWSKGSTLRLSSSEEGDGEDVNELSQSLMFAQAYCERIKKKKSLAHSALLRKKGGADRFSPLQNIALPPGTLRGVCACDLAVHSRYY